MLFSISRYLCIKFGGEKNLIIPIIFNKLYHHFNNRRINFPKQLNNIFCVLNIDFKTL